MRVAYGRAVVRAWLRRRTWPRSLTLRLTALATGATAVVLLVVLVGGLLVFSRQLSHSVDDGLRTRADDLAAAISQSGPTAVRREGLAEVYDRAGTVLASSRTDPAGPPLLPGGTQVTCPGPDVVFRSATPLEGRRSRPLRVLARCLPDGKVLAVAVSVEQERAAEHRLVEVMTLIAPLLLAGVAFTVWRAVRAALRPVDDLTTQARRIDAGADTTLRVPTGGRDDEITRLGQTLHEMLVRLDVAFVREQAFVDDAAHELRTPLAVLRGELELALSDLADQQGVEVSLRAALAETERLARLAEDLLALARQRSAGPQDARELDVAAFLAGFARRMEAAFPLRLQSTCAPGLRLRTGVPELERVLTNVVANAAAAGATRVDLSATPQQGFVGFAVQDDGPGFPPGFLTSAFERFTRADSARGRSSGAGLGLALVHGLVVGLGGSVVAANDSALGGAAVRFQLPVTAG